MITKDEILSVANETGLTPAVVEKDYVLGWLLAAVEANEAFSNCWVFKGGTCLKKCYFETYRFSEDLDFTLQDEAHLEEDFLAQQFGTISEWVYEACGIEIPVERLVFDIYENKRGHKSCEARVYYRSYFIRSQKNLPKIKFDLTADEVLVLPPARQEVFHAYSDRPSAGMHVNCYAYPEVFGEKVRALGERGRPRDLYDVINLFRNDQQPAAPLIQNVLEQKCAYKGISTPKVEDMDAYRVALEQNWQPMLAHQLPALPELEVYWQALPEFFDWLEGRQVEERAPLGAITQSDEVYRPLYGQLGLHSTKGNSLEIIRFAAGNHLCINLDYTANNGKRSSRIIEPYSLRRAQNGNILLYAVRAEDAQIRAYKIDQINDASVTNQVFVPRYQVELSPSASIAPIRQSAGTSSSLGMPRTSNRSSGLSRRRPARRSSGLSSGPTYVYRCPMCNKTFRRKTQNSRLNPHKTKDGWPCSGRAGYYEDTTY
ncbi:MAG: nucleotidyl transferase AbiEii/AbiGii toxin family protein [Alcanivoracaceae bacterium]|nr:nucleotidyl transferase AbiEii/AbiGii toxin family protein [Alcanivoracaceae bacterium]